jgi:thiaminase
MTQEGWLRQQVKVTVLDEVVDVQHQFLTISLPRDWIAREPEIEALLAASIGRQDVSSRDPKVQGVIQLLEAQDCFFQSKAQERYTVREVKELFDRIASTWYSDYYAHPVWQELRQGALPLSGFVAWVLHNYHVSRAAGRSGARCATRYPRLELRSFFAEDVLEEYWHCDAFYFVRHSQLSISDKDVKSYVPLPSSLAFEQHTLDVAESDWLGHLLISYFQESSIRFYSDCREFYSQVEDAYGFPGFFDGWVEHMRLDFAHGHAEGFIRLLDSDEVVTHEELLSSLQKAWYAYYFLTTALDEIADEARRNPAPILRAPVRAGRLDPKISTLAPCIGEVRGSSSGEIAEILVALLGTVHPPKQTDVSYLQNRLRHTIYLALSHAREHDDIILFGRLAEVVESPEIVGSGQPAPPTPSAVALYAFVADLAPQAEQFAFVIYLTHLLRTGWFSISERALAALRLRLAQPCRSDDQKDQLATLGLQYVELSSRLTSERQPVPTFEL